jgi:hypothetical protein
MIIGAIRLQSIVIYHIAWHYVQTIFEVQFSHHAPFRAAISVELSKMSSTHIAGQGKELLEGFQGWLMSERWDRLTHGFPRRLRCWAHLIRNARGLTESYQHEARAHRVAKCWTPCKP